MRFTFVEVPSGRIVGCGEVPGDKGLDGLGSETLLPVPGEYDPARMYWDASLGRMRERPGSAVRLEAGALRGVPVGSCVEVLLNGKRWGLFPVVSGAFDVVSFLNSSPPGSYVFRVDCFPGVDVEHHATVESSERWASPTGLAGLSDVEVADLVDAAFGADTQAALLVYHLVQGLKEVLKEKKA